MPSDRFDKLRPLRFAQHLALAAQALELKRFLAMQRFRRSVYEIAAGGNGLSVIASDLGFSDQADLTRVSATRRCHARRIPTGLVQAPRAGRPISSRRRTIHASNDGGVATRDHDRSRLSRFAFDADRS